MALRELLVCVLLACAARASAARERVGPKEAAMLQALLCAQLGFDPEALDCRVCERFATFLGDAVPNTSEPLKVEQAASVVQSCRTCCTDLEKADMAAQQLYDRVVLEVCTCKFGRYPKVANFVRTRAENHARLQVKYIDARHPHLLFYDEADNMKEEVSIASWDEDTIAEFIEAKLKKDPEATPTSDDVETEGETDDASLSEEDAAGEEGEEDTTEEEKVEEVVEVEVTAGLE